MVKRYVCWFVCIDGKCSSSDVVATGISCDRMYFLLAFLNQ